MKKKISICVPVLNEEKNIKILVNKINIFIKKNLNNKFNYEIIFTDNASSDQTEKEIINLKKKFKHMRYYRFNKNIGYDLSLLKNYQLSNGDAAISIHCDLQDPIEKIEIFLDNWIKGYDLVYGKIIQRNEGPILTFLRRLYYYIFNSLCFKEKKLPINAVDFRLIDKKIILKIKKYKKNYYYARGLTYFFSKKSIHINYTRKNRKFGKSKFNIKNSIIYAVISIISNTDLNKYCVLGVLLNLFTLYFYKHLSFITYPLMLIFFIIIFVSTGLFKDKLSSIKYSKIIK